jgi:hypothetical protein
MTWVASSVALVAGVGGSIMSSNASKKIARKQAALGRAAAAKLRAKYVEISAGSKREIETLRTLRSMDIPAFKQASEQAVIQAQKGSERMQRQRMMGNQPGEVRDAIFGGQFQQYVGREIQRLGQYTAITKELLSATERQQQMAMQVESQASSLEMGGASQSLQTEAAAGDLGANILGAVGQAAGAYASASAAKSAAATKADTDLRQATAVQTVDPTTFMKNGTFDTEAYNRWLKSVQNPGT